MWGKTKTIQNCFRQDPLLCRYIRAQQPTIGSASIQVIRRKSAIKVVRMTAMSIAAFVLSWSPYAIVSIVATIRGTNVLTPDLAEIPDLLAKAWVIYNPIVYTAMNERFRNTLKRIVPIRCTFRKGTNPFGKKMSPTVESRPTHACTIPYPPRGRTQSVVHSGGAVSDDEHSSRVFLNRQWPVPVWNRSWSRSGEKVSWSMGYCTANTFICLYFSLAFIYLL